MNILLIDVTGCFLDFALRSLDCGHTIRWFIGPTKEGLRSRIGDGIEGIQRVGHWEQSMNWADLIVLSDNVKYIHGLEGYKQRGYPIVGPSKETTAWELDRAKGQEVFQRCGIEVMSSTPFTSYDKAKEHVMKEMKRFVSKPNGEADKALSYVSKSPADMCFMLDYWKKNSKHKGEFILQEFVPGIEMAVGGWFGPGGWSSFVCENFEHKKLMNGDVGVNTGEMGTCLKYCTWEDSLLAREMLEPLTGELYRQGYCGYIDVAVIIDEKGNPWPLEFTTRPGWPLFQIQQAVHPDDPATWMFDMVNGEDTFKPSTKIATGVVIALPDFPYTRLTKKELHGYPVYGITDSNWNNIHPSEMAMGIAPLLDGDRITYQDTLVSAGDYLLTVSGVGKDVRESKKKAYKVVKELEIPNSPMYRTDIGHRLEEQLPKIQKFGYAETWEYGDE